MEKQSKAENGTFTQVPNVFFETCDLPESAQVFYLRLLSKVGHAGCRFAGSLRKLSKLVRLSKSTVDRMSKKLRDAGLINIEYGQSEEESGQVMIITLNKEELWNLNKYHYHVKPVPNWDSKMPDCPNLGQSVPQMGQYDFKLGQSVPSASSKVGDNNNKHLNTEEDNKNRSSSSKMGYIKMAMKECLLAFGYAPNDREQLERAHALFMEAGCTVPEFRTAVDSAFHSAQMAGEGIEL